MTFSWVLLDRERNELRATEMFASQDEAEAWMGSEWSSLREEGAEFVSLRDGDEQIYRMGLNED